MRTRLALLLAPVLFVACGSGSPTAPEDVAITFETVVNESYSGFSARQRRAVRSDGEWVQVWQTLYAGSSPVPAVPAVDFGRETVVLAAAGERPDGCYSIAITRATSLSDGAVQFEVSETVPGPTCICTQAQTQPVHVVKIARISTRESFVERSFQRAC